MEGKGCEQTWFDMIYVLKILIIW